MKDGDIDNEKVNRIICSENIRRFLWILITVTIYSFIVLKYQMGVYNNLSLNYDFSNLTTGTIIESLRGSDIHSYILGAKHFIENHNFQYWTFNLWPAGLQLLISAFLIIFGDTYYPLAYFCFINILWAVVLNKTFLICRNEQISRWKSWLIAFAPFVFCSFSVTFLGWPLYFSEGIAAPFFVFLMLEFFQWIKTRQLKRILAVAISFSVLANARSPFFSIAIFWFVGLITLLTLMWVLFSLKAYYKGNEFFDVIKFSKHMLRTDCQNEIKRDLKNVSIAFCILLITFSPWIARNAACKNSWPWNYTGFVWVGNWWADDLWPGMNTAYKVNPKLGNYLYSTSLNKLGGTAYEPEQGVTFYRNLTVSEFLAHPIKWYKIKSKYLYKYFWRSENLPFPMKGERPKNIIAAIRVENIFFLILLPIISLIEIYKLFKLFLIENAVVNAKHKMNVFMEAYFCLAVLFLHVGAFTFAHFEVRYSMFLKLMSLYYFFLLLLEYKRRKSNC